MAQAIEVNLYNIGLKTNLKFINNEHNPRTTDVLDIIEVNILEENSSV